MNRLLSNTLVALTVATVASGCGTRIRYRPMTGGTDESWATVGLKVLNERPADTGGTTASVAKNATDADREIIVNSITEATTDALRHAGIAVQPDAPRTLVARVGYFWVAGYIGYRGTVTVNYTLQNSDHKSSWSKEIRGGAGGASFWFGQKYVQDILENALADFANKAKAEFTSDAFTRELKPVAAAAPEPPKESPAGAAHDAEIDAKLMHLQDLFNRKLITKQEYETQKAEVLKGL